MHNCMIAPLIRIDKENLLEWKAGTRDWEPTTIEEDDWCQEFRYRGTWSQFFDKMADGLPNLKEFCFRGGENLRSYGVENRDLHGGAEVYPQRYVVFNNGILPTHWPEANGNGGLEDFYDYEEGQDVPNFHLEFLEKDKKSLERLLEKCRARREADGM